MIVYTQPQCRGCDRVKNTLREAGVPFSEVNILEDTDAYNHLKAIGAKSVPVVEAEGHEPVMGYDMGKLQDLIHDFVFEGDEE